MADIEVKTVRLGTSEVQFPSPYLQPLEACNHLLGNRDALLKELDEKGYLYIRGLHDREEVLQARLAVLQHIMTSGEGKLDLQERWEAGVLDLRCGKGCLPFMEKFILFYYIWDTYRGLKGKRYLLIRNFHDREEILQARIHVLHIIQNLGPKKLDSSFPVDQGVLDKRCGQGCIPQFQGKNDVTHSDAINKILEGPRPYEFFKTLFGEPARTFDYKWLRAVHRQAFTGAHVDNVYMARGTSNLYTMWTPFGDCDPDIGCLAVCEGSNKLPSFQKLHETYSETDIEAVNLNGTGWFTTDPYEITERFGGQWKTTNYRAGDVLIFSMKTVHMSTANMTDLVRISCDTRWQPATEPADSRYVGDDVAAHLKFGLHAKDTKTVIQVTMEELKAKWGFQ